MLPCSVEAFFLMNDHCLRKLGDERVVFPVTASQNRAFCHLIALNVGNVN